MHAGAAEQAIAFARQNLQAFPGDIDAILTDLEFVSAFGTEAFFTMARTDDGLPMAFAVRFILDGDGLWRLDSF